MRLRHEVGFAMLSLVLSLAPSPARGGEADAPLDTSRIVKKDEEGRFVVVPPREDARVRNPAWPAELEEEYLDRVDHIIKTVAKQRVGFTTYFEGEKRGYGLAMIQVLAGDRGALRKLQERDAQAGSWHKHTLGIDWYACFTIKHQVRKYFFFGGLLDPAYRKLMRDSAKIWTEKDPLRRPHHSWVRGKGGWGPDAKNSWADVRNTDNLFMMRTVAVYLMAEETGNAATARKYKESFATYVKSLYRIGMGEWDSENYHGHTIAPVHSMYDFAKDPEVKLLAKAALDWLYAAAALKYWRGGFNMPTKRDYNKVAPFQGSASILTHVYFGDAPKPNEHFESDEIHVITSAYRPPLAVMKLARKEFERPCEILSAKPSYDAPRKGDYAKPPEYYETDYFGHSFAFGTVSTGVADGSDVGAWKVMTWDEKEGVDYIQAMPGPDPQYPGSAKYQRGKVSGPNRIAQYRNLAIWLVKKGDAPWFWVLPKTIAVEEERGVTFLRADSTWLALHPVNLRIRGVDAKLTEQVNWDVKTKKGKTERKPRWPDHQAIGATGRGGGYSGFAVEIGEGETHGGYDRFKRKVLRASRLDASGLARGEVEFRGANGNSVGMQFADRLEDYKVRRNGKLHDWNAHRVMYRNADGGESPIHQDWIGGTLTVDAGGARFTCTVADDGKVTFTNE